MEALKCLFAFEIAQISAAELIISLQGLQAKLGEQMHLAITQRYANDCEADVNRCEENLRRKPRSASV